MKYDVDIEKLIKTLLPFTLRSKSVLSLLCALCIPFRLLYSGLISFKNEVSAELSYNSQYPSMQRLLNDKLDPTLRRILVEDDSSTVDGLFIYPEVYEDCILLEEAETTNNCTLITESSAWGHNPFVVKLPAALFGNTDTLNQASRLIKKYKYYGVKYKIISL